MRGSAFGPSIAEDANNGTADWPGWPCDAGAGRDDGGEDPLRGGCSGEDCRVSLETEWALSGLDAEPLKDELCDAPAERGLAMDGNVCPACCDSWARSGFCGQWRARSRREPA